MNNINRREFMAQAGRLAALTGTAGILSGCPGPLDTPVDPSTRTWPVFTVRGQSLRTMTRKALNIAGGIERIVNPGESVFIKVNMMTVGMVPGNSIVLGESTKPEIAMTLAEECLRAGASSVIIGDAAQRKHFSWDFVPSLNGKTNYALEAARLNELYGPRLRLACLMGDCPDWVEVPSPFTNLGTLKIARVAMEADRLFSVAVFKTHMTTKITGA